jgi:Ran-interacting Mog1 protein
LPWPKKPLSNHIPTNSDLREIPSHQEVWLSPTTLTNIIIEINQYETSQPSDAAAVTYHFKDVIDPEDTLQELSQPSLVEMNSSSLAKFAAYTISGIVVAREKAKSVLHWEQTPQMVDAQTVIHQLVIRMRDVETDLCVRINVPLKEFESGKEAGEVKMGQEIVEKVIESLDVVDFGLFDG